MAHMLKVNTTLSCDVLVIGAGGAGLRCAAEILEQRPGAKVLAVTKVAHPQKSHTSTAQGGVCAVDPSDPHDNPAYHMFDTWKGSDCSADQNVVKKIVETGWDQLMWLENRGMHFTRLEGGELGKRTFGGHTSDFGKVSSFRAVFDADRTGKSMMDTCWQEAVKGGITFISQSVLTELLFSDGRCIGAILFSEKEGEFIGVTAKATVLATGGCGQVFRITTNCRDNTGDALAVILRAGFPVMDAEAVQFHPTGIVGPGILASEALRSEGGILRNRDLEPFMERYAPKMKELAPRDIVSRAMESEIRNGKGVLNPDHNIEHVWIDLRELPDYVHDVKLKEISGFFKTFANIDPKKELCPVRSSNHYHMGGIPTTEFGEVQQSAEQIVPGLFAVGECASASFHGFNRLGTNSLLELFTMGKFVGERVCDYIQDGALTELPKDAGEATFTQFSRYLEASGTGNIGVIREEMRNLMTAKVGIFRKGDEMAEAMESLKELRERAEAVALAGRTTRMNQELRQRWELDNLLELAMIITRGAYERKESRGGHYRDDYTERSEEFDYHTLAYMTEFGSVRLGKRSIDMSIFEAGGEHSEYFKMIPRKY